MGYRNVERSLSPGWAEVFGPDYAARLVFVAMSHLARDPKPEDGEPNTPIFSRPYADLEARLGMPRRTLQDVIKRLIGYGAITRTRQGSNVRGNVVPEFTLAHDASKALATKAKDAARAASLRTAPRA